MFKVEVNVNTIAADFRDSFQKAEQLARQRVTALAAQTHAHIVEKASEQLHSSREKYLQALKYSQVDKDTWLVELERSAFWIEDGIEPGKEMIDDLLREKPGSKSRVKTAKDGSKYRVIPFKHSEAPSKMTEAARDLQSTIRSELKKAKIPYQGIERNPDGSPKTGLLHKLDIMNKPLHTGEGWKKLHGFATPGMGWGMPGHVRQGATGIPFLQGIRIYQRAVVDENGNAVKDKSGQQKARRDIMTFRIVSTKHKGSGRWTHPGFEGKKFLDEAYEWATKEWNDRLLPEIYRELGKS